VLAFERDFWQQHPGRALAGVDEAGRGPLAGPVVAAAVAIPADVAERLYEGPLRGLTDSKQLTALRRERFFSQLVDIPGVAFATGWVEAAQVDDLNILGATHLAMRLALLQLPVAPDHALVDGLPVGGLPCASTAIVGGDRKSFLIAAASVVAKVLRDRRMVELHALYPRYNFSSNKGYGSHEHVNALLRHGPCPEHRRTFRPVQDALQCLPGLRPERDP
jgi:ribonuclease HII